MIAITQDDVINRLFIDESHRAYVPDFGCYIDEAHPEGGAADHAELRAIFDEELEALLPKKKAPAPVT